MGKKYLGLMLGISGAILIGSGLNAILSSDIAPWIFIIGVAMMIVSFVKLSKVE